MPGNVAMTVCMHACMHVCVCGGGGRGERERESECVHVRVCHMNENTIKVILVVAVAVVVVAFWYKVEQIKDVTLKAQHCNTCTCDNTQNIPFAFGKFNIHSLVHWSLSNSGVQVF